MGSKFSKAVPHANRADLAGKVTTSDTSSSRSPSDMHHHSGSCQASRLPLSTAGPIAFATSAPNATSSLDPLVVTTTMDKDMQPAPSLPEGSQPVERSWPRYFSIPPPREANTTATEQAHDNAANSPPPPPPPPPPVIDLPPPPPPPPPPVLSRKKPSDIPCVICCEWFPADQKYTSFIYPCKCTSAYCASCIKDMFLKACEDISRMPPHCCERIHLHHARPFLTTNEAADFREKYEEWSTPHPFYCPVPTCSAFIPYRILHRSREARNGKERVDSVLGTPTSPLVACPKCETDICTNCRHVAHGKRSCELLDFGVDEETAALLKRWGYKKCPRCGQGVRRMYGCNHMECLCGAHFCWVCLKARDDCEGQCYSEDEEDDHSDEEAQSDAEEEVVTRPENETRPAEIGSAADEEAIPEPAHTAEPKPTPPLIERPRNLDAGSRRYWEDLGLDFGEEPTDDVQDASWSCQHEFFTSKISLEASLRSTSSTSDMECTMCWSTVHPEIKLPNMVNRHDSTMIKGIQRANAYTARGRGRVPRIQMLRDTARRDLSVSTIAGTSQSTPSDPMEDVQIISNNGDRVVDIYGNIVSTTDWVIQPPRRASFDFTARPFMDFSRLEHGHGNKPLDGAVDIVSSSQTNNAPFSLAYECRWCNSCLQLVQKRRHGRGNEETDAR